MVGGGVMIPRDVAQTLITKLDLGHVKPCEAANHAARYGVALTARTRDKMAREIGRAMQRPASEPVTLADGAADQSLIPGVAPVPLSARQLEAERQRREQRHGHAPLPCGGLWDETAQRQGSLF